MTATSSVNSSIVSSDRLSAAYQKAREDLLDAREDDGHWIGKLATSSLSTATAVSALAIVLEQLDSLPSDDDLKKSKNNLQRHISAGLQYLTDCQNPDGGWGDTEKSYSNIATSMLVIAAFHLTKTQTQYSALIDRAENYVQSQGKIDGLRKRYGKDKTFAVPILTNCALAGIVPWSEVSPLPFELSCLPQQFYSMLRLPVVSYAVPALVGIGQARYFHQKPKNPLMRLIRSLSVERSMKVLERMQPASGGFLEAVPLTSFVVMGLASTGRLEHPVARQGIKFLLSSVRDDGSWPIDTNLAAWNTSLSLAALAANSEDIAGYNCLNWLLSCQNQKVHPYTGSPPGGWGWSDLSGAVPDADDTPAALLALHAWHESPSCSNEDRSLILKSVRLGGKWLLGLQNSDGGWPTFCPGWTNLPFDRSGADLTAHAVRALFVWKEFLPLEKTQKAIDRGLRFLAREQNSDGSWYALWFGNQDHPEEENPIYGTSKVLFAYRDLGLLQLPEAKRGRKWIEKSQNPDGGWGSSFTAKIPGKSEKRSSVEESALALEAILPGDSQNQSQDIIIKGLRWIVTAVEEGKHQEASPIGFYFAKLWYYEELYPLTFTVSALGQAIRHSLLPTEQRSTLADLPNG